MVRSQEVVEKLMSKFYFKLLIILSQQEDLLMLVISNNNKTPEIYTINQSLSYFVKSVQNGVTDFHDFLL